MSDEERERAFKRERDAMEAWKTGHVDEPPGSNEKQPEEASDAEAHGT